MARRGENNIGLIMILGAGAFGIYKWWRDNNIGSINIIPGSVTNSGSVALTGEARGIRNNNPGNIKYSAANNWTGQTGTDGTFSKFNTAINGFRAMARILKTYQSSYGLNTISKMAARWAPASENNVSAWASNVALGSGIGINDAINTNNRGQMIALMRGIVVAENGTKYKNYYSDSVIGAGFDAS